MKRQFALATFLLAGCSTMEPQYVRPQAAIPASWPAGDSYLRQSEAALPSVTYQQIFRDPRLQSLVERALVANEDLALAAANVVSAREQYHIQRAQSLPTIDAAAGLSGAHSPGSIGTQTQVSAGLGTTSFELDLFGRIRSLTKAQFNRYLATEAGARAVRLTLVGQIAVGWLSYAEDSSLLKIAEDTEASAQRTVGLTRARLTAGVAPRTDLLQALQILDQAQADVANQRTAVAQDANLLQLLVGAPVDPGSLPASIDDAAATIGELPAGVDSSVLLRRPDVMQAEFGLRAANADIGAARAALLPKISLTGLLSFATNAIGSLLSGGALGWSGLASANYPIFQGGAGKANVHFSEAQREAAVATYQKTLQTAFREVADALARQGTVAELTRAEGANLQATADSYRIMQARYRAGIDPFLATLVAQRSYYLAQQQLVATRFTAASNRVDLYEAVGGDSLYAAAAPPGAGAGAQ
jgi:multidrug efflux system outer membrane protein